METACTGNPVSAQRVLTTELSIPPEIPITSDFILLATA
jgi:hypothetical protein